MVNQPADFTLAGRWRIPVAGGFLIAATLLIMPVSLILLAGCQTTAEKDTRLPVAVSILPQATFVERIGGPQVHVTVAVAPGQSPASFDATPRQVTRLGSARVYFATGVPMENLLLPRLQAGFPDLTIIDTTGGLPLRHLNEAHRHTADGDGERHHPSAVAGDAGEAGDANAASAEFDPHVWLNPRLVQVQVRHLATALAELDPPHAATYQTRCDSFVAELAALDRQLATLLAPVAGRDLFVFHPAFGYLTDAYGLHQVAIEQGGLDPSPRHLAEVLTRVREQGARVVFVQPQFSLGSARAIAQTAGVELIVLDPLARDYVANLRQMALTIREALDES